MRQIAQITFLLIILSSCNKNDKIEGIWITKDYPNCPYVIKFSDGLLVENLIAKSYGIISTYQISDSVLILKRLSDIFLNSSVDTIKYEVNNNYLTIDTLDYLKIGFGNNYFEDFITVSGIDLSLPKLDYDVYSDFCSNNTIILPKQINDSLKFMINGVEFNSFDFHGIIRELKSDWDYSNSVRFIVDSRIDYGTLNKLRDYLRRVGIYKHEYIFLNSHVSELNYFDTYNTIIRSRPMSEIEYEQFDSLLKSHGVKLPMPPPPPPSFLSFSKRQQSARLLQCITSNIYKLNKQEVSLNKLKNSKFTELMGNDNILLLDISDSFEFSNYLDLKLFLRKSFIEYRDSLSITKFNKKYKDLEEEEEDIIDKETWFFIIELNQYDAKREN